MNDFTIDIAKRFITQYGKMPLADFGGGRHSTTVWRNKNLPELGITDWETYDLEGGTKTLDLTKDMVKEKFNTILCLDVLEHVKDPFAVARNIVQALSPGGYALIVAPFKWNRHGVDYFRYTEKGLSVLFEGVEIIKDEKSISESGEEVSIIIKK